MPPGRISSPPDPGKPLSRGPFRSVFLVPAEEVAGGEALVIKRFCHRDRLRRLRDGVRARREVRILAHLRAAGVRVPRPLRVVESRPAWDVHMEAVPDATPLERLFEARAAPVGGWEPLLRRLGGELARVQAARVHLRDLGPKNVLVDGEGRPWLIDFHAARLRPRAFSAAEVWADVRAAAAAAREDLPARLRLRFLASWRRAAGTRETLDLGAFETGARLQRRATVARGLGRWLRESSRCSLHRTTLTRRGRTPGQVAYSDTLPVAEARRRWVCAARLLEHGIPVVQPGELEQTGRRARVTFDEPARWSTEGVLRGLLRDRGLALPAWEAALLSRDELGVALRAPEQVLETRE